MVFCIENDYSGVDSVVLDVCAAPDLPKLLVIHMSIAFMLPLSTHAATNLVVSGHMGAEVLEGVRDDVVVPNFRPGIPRRVTISQSSGNE